MAIMTHASREPLPCSHLSLEHTPGHPRGSHACQQCSLTLAPYATAVQIFCCRCCCPRASHYLLSRTVHPRQLTAFQQPVVNKHCFSLPLTKCTHDALVWSVHAHGAPQPLPSPHSHHAIHALSLSFSRFFALCSTERPENLDGVDFSNYFCAYGYLYNQKEMLEDNDRMQAYYESVIGNSR
jgi:hypothetical protein